MKKIYLFALFLILSISNRASAQEADSVKQHRITYLRKELGVPQAKATEVAQIIDNYKLKAKALSNNTSLTEEDKRFKFQELIDAKNASLTKILTEQQLQKIVPSTERKKNP
jgi:hypothetical protein